MMVVSLPLSWHSSQGVPDGKVFERPIGLRQLARHIMETWIAVVSVHVCACECVDVCVRVCVHIQHSLQCPILACSYEDRSSLL